MTTTDRELLKQLGRDLKEYQEATRLELREFRQSTAKDLREIRESVQTTVPLLDHRVTVVETAQARHELRLSQIEKNQVRYSAFFAGLGMVGGYVLAALIKGAFAG